MLVSIEVFQCEIDYFLAHVEIFCSRFVTLLNVDLDTPNNITSPINGNIKKQHRKKSTPAKPVSRTDSLGSDGS